MLPIDAATGALGQEASDFKDHGSVVGTGAGVNIRQDMAHPHQILLDPDHRHVFVPDLGKNAVYSYGYAAAGRLSEPVQVLQFHDGCGPRHMCFSPDSKRCYVLGELDNSITTCSYDAASGTLQILAKCSALTEGTPHADKGGSAEIIMSPDGRFVYATIRGTGEFSGYDKNFCHNMIATLAVLGSQRTLTLLENTPSGGNMPWTMTWADKAAGGQFLLVQVRAMPCRPTPRIAPSVFACRGTLKPS
eukprot:SAG22_NODE_2477_length_2530_cov_1.385027_3_plen_247_part_00